MRKLIFRIDQHRQHFGDTFAQKECQTLDTIELVSLTAVLDNETTADTLDTISALTLASVYLYHNLDKASLTYLTAILENDTTVSTLCKVSIATSCNNLSSRMAL